MSRLKAMLPLVRSNLSNALRARAVLHEGNEIVGAKYVGVSCSGVSAYNTIKHALTMYLALVTSRLYDGPTSRSKRHPNNSDIASIPLLIRLLERKRCRDELVSAARLWNGEGIASWAAADARQVEQAIDAAISAHSTLKTREGRRALRSLRSLRDAELAHTLLRTRDEPDPIYNQIFMLLDVAVDVVGNCVFAIEGHKIDLALGFDRTAAEARQFWEPALLAAIAGGARK